ncbi:MAG: exodeoxyribonuclease III [Spirochaetes bacterium]|nr:MAG: exodeoxyribonuclease III [Spirochaetota bacterium]
MIIATFNANSIRARMPIIIDWLAEQAPDVLCVQETKVRDEEFPIQAFTDAGYTAIYKGEKSYNGVAILSRLPAERVFYGFDGEGADEGTRLIGAWISGIPVVNTYVPQGTDPLSPKFKYKLGWLARLRDFFSARFSPGAPLVWVGDINIAPERKDVFDSDALYGKVGFHPEEHKALRAITEWGFEDIYRKFHQEAGRYSFWDYRLRDAVKKGLGWRLDHIRATGALAARATDAWIDMEPRLRERPSDHTFVCAKFDL